MAFNYFWFKLIYKKIFFKKIMMHFTIDNLIKIKNQINTSLIELKKNKTPKIIAVSKTFPLESILPLIDFGHRDFGENKVQECIDKWKDIKSKIVILSCT